jgi:hypothetical protein
MGGILQVDSVLNNNTSNLITQTNSTTITIGSTGQTISLASGASSSGFGLSWNSTVQTTNFTASVGVGYMVNTTTAAITATLPAAPSIGDQVAFVDFNETAATNAIALNPNGLKIDGLTTNTFIRNGGEGVTILYSGTTRGWIPVSAVNEGTQALSSDYTVDFLVIAGGGAGGNVFANSGQGAGGAGAGGYRNSYASEQSGGGGSSEASLTFNPGTVYTITVGAGAPTNSTNDAIGGNGNNSSISGSGISTITSIGGGGGGGNSVAPYSGQNGGSGGSGQGNAPAGLGTANQGFNGNSNASGSGSSGGGGAGAIGVSASGSNGGNGGVGLASSITGSSVSRGGGGGGSCSGTGGTIGSGGTGGGGNSASNVALSTAGSINTGGGGGGGNAVDAYAAGGAGGSGVVILRMATIHYSGTTSGSPTVTTDGSDTILRFTGSGTYTG